MQGPSSKCVDEVAFDWSILPPLRRETSEDYRNCYKDFSEMPPCDFSDDEEKDEYADLPPLIPIIDEEPDSTGAGASSAGGRDGIFAGGSLSTGRKSPMCQTSVPRMYRSITMWDGYIGDPINDEKIKENNDHNNVKVGDEGYIPLSHEVELCQRYVEEYRWPELLCPNLRK